VAKLSLLQRFAASPGAQYSSGEQNLDTVLLGQPGNAQGAIKQAAQQTTTVTRTELQAAEGVAQTASARSATASSASLYKLFQNQFSTIVQQGNATS
jgi:hypothetical protein